jgi:hypothetical protein
VNSGASEPRNISALFFMHGWYWYGFGQKRTGTSYAELLFLHPVGSMSQVVYFGASGHETSTHYFSCMGGPTAVSIKNAPGPFMPKLCFCIRSDLRVT